MAPEDLTEEVVLSVLTSRSVEEARRELADLIRRARAAERNEIVLELRGMHAEYLNQGRQGTTLQILGEAARFIADPGECAVAAQTRRGKRVKAA